MTMRVSLKSRLPQVRATLPDKLDTTVRLGAEGIAQDAQSRVPVASGDLRDAIHVEKEADAHYRVVAGDSDVFYGHLVEFGTSNTAARPFLVPAAEGRKDDILASIRRMLKGL